jgi:hypothetical protein
VAFDRQMENVLDAYTWPYDPTRQLVCMDETRKQLLKKPRPPIPTEPGLPALVDYAYERGGVANLSPHGWWRPR